VTGSPAAVPPSSQAKRGAWGGKKKLPGIRLFRSRLWERVVEKRRKNCKDEGRKPWFKDGETVPSPNPKLPSFSQRRGGPASAQIQSSPPFPKGGGDQRQPKSKAPLLFPKEGGQLQPKSKAPLLFPKEGGTSVSWWGGFFHSGVVPYPSSTTCGRDGARPSRLKRLRRSATQRKCRGSALCAS